MSLQFAAARAISSVSTWGLKNVFHRPAAYFPGKAALRVDPQVIAHASSRLTKGSVMVVGTNGKTTVTNLLADVLEGEGALVACNRTGANLGSGVAAALLHAKSADWGVFEIDELWLAKTLPQLQATYVVLLNLFRDQLDRMGEISRIQDSIVGALTSSPATTLIYNADDPLCAAIADRIANPTIGFGIGEDLGLPQNSVADALMCQKCSGMLEYAYRQYGQLGDYSCPTCGFSRPALAYAARNVELSAAGLSFSLEAPPRQDGTSDKLSVRAPFNGAYMVYNLAAVAAVADTLGCTNEAIQRAIDAFDPQNGRLQAFDLEGRRVLLNLAKNPTGFNQNLKIVVQDPARKAVAFFVNYKEGDGRDVSWLWDIDFEELGAHDGLVVLAGGARGRDMQVRLKYAGINADVVENADDALERVYQLPKDANAYLIANYTALPIVQDALNRRVEAGRAAHVAAAASSSPSAGDSEPVSSAAAASAAAERLRASTAPAPVGKAHSTASAANASPQGADAAADPLQMEGVSAGSSLGIAHLFPDLLNLYGDGGNVRILEQRLAWRGIPVQVERVRHGQSVDLSSVDLVVLGGGPDREQRLASVELMRMRDDLKAYVEDDGVLLAVCGGYQILGYEWLLGDEVVKGLGIVDMTTERPGTSADRLIDNIVLRSPLLAQPIVGYENHAGRTHLGTGVEAFGDVVSAGGHGNNDDDRRDGVRYKNVIGTYLHGPLLAKNPHVADDLLARALDRHVKRTGKGAGRAALVPLDDAVELAANEELCKRFGVA